MSFYVYLIIGFIFLTLAANERFYKGVRFPDHFKLEKGHYKIESYGAFVRVFKIEDDGRVNELFVFVRGDR